MPTLYEKVYGCLAASRVRIIDGRGGGGWSPERIKETYGFVDGTRICTMRTGASIGSVRPEPPRTASSGRS